MSGYLINAATTVPWLMSPVALDTVMAVLGREGDVQALETRLGRPLDNTRTVVIREGVAVVPVTGPIVRYANLFTEISGGTSTQVLATDIQSAIDNPEVRAIVLDVDSPGGAANGINELAELIYAARDIKPIVAYVGGEAASAGYWIASAAGRIVIDETALLGSVGVVLNLIKRDARPGERTYEIVSSNAPNKRPDLETEGGRAQLQTLVDEMSTVFLDKVARNRGLDRETVNDQFRRGGVATGVHAVNAGMADALGSLESVIAELAAGDPAHHLPPRKPSMTTVRTTEELQAAIAAGTDPKTITIAAAESIDVKAIEATAIEGERARCKGLIELNAAGFEQVIASAIDDGSTVEAAGLAMFKAACDRGISLAGIQNDATQASRAKPPAGSSDDAERAAAVKAIVGNRG